MDNVLLRTLYVGYWNILQRFLVNCAIWCVLGYIFLELSLKNMYILILLPYNI